MSTYQQMLEQIEKTELESSPNKRPAEGVLGERVHRDGFMTRRLRPKGCSI